MPSSRGSLLDLVFVGVTLLCLFLLFWVWKKHTQNPCSVSNHQILCNISPLLIFNMRTIIQWLKHDGIPAQAQARGSRIVKHCRRVKQSISIQENFHRIPRTLCFISTLHFISILFQVQLKFSPMILECIGIIFICV